MKWSQRAWEAVEPMLKETVRHPFIQELISGELEKDKFVFYLQQDAIYLTDYGKLMSGIAARLHKPEHIELFVHFASESVLIEKTLHDELFHEFEIEKISEPAPACLLYSSYLIKQLAQSSIEVAVASVLPCFWVYKEVGDYILNHQNKDNNPYQSWINTYGGEEFATYVKKAIDICDELAEQTTEAQRKAMLEAFVVCTKLEYYFWDAAYKKEKWII